MRVYETLFIVKPDVPEEEIDQRLEALRGQLASAGAAIDKVEKWGKRKLAYKVDKYREGSYVLLQFAAEPAAVKEFERRLRISDIVLKYLTVRIDYALKRLEKRRKEREKRAARRAVRGGPAAAAAAGTPAAPGRPAGEAPPAPGLPEEG
jgi:small subunit ribosomal protein S6